MFSSSGAMVLHATGPSGERPERISTWAVSRWVSCEPSGNICGVITPASRACSRRPPPVPQSVRHDGRGAGHMQTGKQYREQSARHAHTFPTRVRTRTFLPTLTIFILFRLHVRVCPLELKSGSSIQKYSQIAEWLALTKWMIRVSGLNR